MAWAISSAEAVWVPAERYWYWMSTWLSMYRERVSAVV